MLHPKLYKKDSKGNTRLWQVETDEAGSYRTISGLLLGNLVESGWTLCKAKNVGRSNETNEIVQCELEVAALYQKKLDKHYVESVSMVDDERKYFEVMLAKELDEKHKSKLKFGTVNYYTQPKLDGLRGPTTKDGTFSRGGNEFEAVSWLAKEVLADIFKDHPDIIFDGELYNHEYADDFNEIVSTIKNGGSPEQTAKAREIVQFHIYDMFDPAKPDQPFSVRQVKLRMLLQDYGIEAKFPGFIQIVRTDPVESLQHLELLYDEYLNLGYEGLMLRVDAKYEGGKRSAFLWKYKPFMEREFPIIRIEEGKGNWAGYAKRIFLEMPNGTESKASMKGTQAYLHGVLREKDEYVGGEATVRFFGFTPDGKLRFGRSLAGKLYKNKRND